MSRVERRTCSRAPVSGCGARRPCAAGSRAAPPIARAASGWSRAHAGSAAQAASSASSAAWLSVEKLAGSAMSGGATPSSTLRRTACGNWRWYSSATRVPYDAPTRSIRSAPSARRTASRSCIAIVVVKKRRSPRRRRRTAASAARPCMRRERAPGARDRPARRASRARASAHSSGAEPAGAALVDEDDVAPVVEPAEAAASSTAPPRSRSGPGRRRAGTPGRRACGAPSPERRRSGSSICAPCGPRRVERPRAARRTARRCGCRRRGIRRAPRSGGAAAGGALAIAERATRRGSDQRCRATAARRAGDARRRRHSPSVRFSSPLVTSRSSSSAPPISVPLTNTIGKVGQPVHIFSALRAPPFAEVAAVLEVVVRRCRRRRAACAPAARAGCRPCRRRAPGSTSPPPGRCGRCRR